MTARIARLTRFLEAGAPGEVLREANLLAGLGLEGNLRQGGERQLCLLSAEIRQWMDSQTESGLCFARFRENLLIEGGTLDGLPVGSRLSLGDAVLRISERGKRCFGECALFSRGMPCKLAGGAAFAVVERGGAIRVGDPVSVVA